MHIRSITVAMTENNFIEVHIEGGKGVQPLSVDNYDITENENYRKTEDLVNIAKPSVFLKYR